MLAIQSQIDNEPGPAVQTLEWKTQELHEAVSRYLPLFYKRAYRYLRHSHDAEDAVQDALLSAYKHLDQFKGSAKMATWITTIVTNSALSQLRKRSRQPHLSLDESLGRDQNGCVSDRLVDVRSSPEEECALSESRRHLMQCVGALSPSFQQAIQLRDIEELSTSEAAHILGVPESTIKTRVSRARSELKRQAKLGPVRSTSTTTIQASDILHDATDLDS